jgi:hypothetical protein
MSNSNSNDRNRRNILGEGEPSSPPPPHDCRFLVQVRSASGCSWECSKTKARLLSAATCTAGVPVPDVVRIELWECGIEDPEIDTWDRVRLLKREGKKPAPEDERAFERIWPRVRQCLTCRCEDPPDVDDGPDFDRSVGDLIADARAKKDAEAEPAPVVPQPEPAPVLPDLTPKAKEKRKPKPKPRARRGKDDWGMG